MDHTLNQMDRKTQGTMRTQLLLLALVAAAATTQAQTVPDSTQSPTIGPNDETSEVRARSTEPRSYTHAPAVNTTGQGEIKQKGSRSFSIARLFDPEGRNRWRQMNSKAARKYPDSPPGTVPLF